MLKNMKKKAILAAVLAAVSISAIGANWTLIDTGQTVKNNTWQRVLPSGTPNANKWVALGGTVAPSAPPFSRSITFA